MVPFQSDDAITRRRGVSIGWRVPHHHRSVLLPIGRALSWSGKASAQEGRRQLMECAIIGRKSTISSQNGVFTSGKGVSSTQSEERLRGRSDRRHQAEGTSSGRKVRSRQRRTPSLKGEGRFSPARCRRGRQEQHIWSEGRHRRQEKKHQRRERHCH